MGAVLPEVRGVKWALSVMATEREALRDQTSPWWKEVDLILT